MRFQLRFGLRMLIAVVSILAVSLGIVFNGSHQQRTAVNWVRFNGGGVQYDYERTGSDVPGPTWARSIVGVDLFAAPVAVDLNYTMVKDITPLSHLRELETVTLIGTYVEDLTPLSPLIQLETLYLDATEISDVRPLMALKQLRYLDLTGNKIENGDLQRLQAALPQCRIVW